MCNKLVIDLKSSGTINKLSHAYGGEATTTGHRYDLFELGIISFEGIC